MGEETDNGIGKVRDFDLASSGTHLIANSGAVLHKTTQTERRDNKVIAAAQALASGQSVINFSNGITIEWRKIEYSLESPKKV